MNERERGGYSENEKALEKKKQKVECEMSE